ncbi:type VI secretion system Vgr family protein [Paraburkholderia adhaesiva]|uniref:type VI secretion system Vgr family protein n=1 Tax=Paraburkholderia adhaesiva TaxID=2883244 RepID=UPI001F18080A|nr:type VI secretion system Vgr family protein [Paraburkholderia adhaesiva]
MDWLRQPRILELSGAALPAWRDLPLFTVSRVSGKEKLGHLYDYTVEVATLEDMMLGVREAQSLVDVDQLVGKEVTVSIAIEGRGDGFIGIANVGAGTRTITGLIVSARCVGADDRRAFYQFRIRPWLWLASLKIDSRIYQDKTVVEITDAILENYPYPYEKRLNGPGFGRGYPRRDYQRQAWESDFAFLNRLWQEWGISFFYEDSTLVLVDSVGGYRKHGPAYATLRYLAPEGQRIDEEHVSQFEIARTLTTGKVSVTDYDYTRSRADLAAKDQDFQKRAFDNYEEYAWGDYSQPLAGMMGIEGEPNDAWFEGEHLACVRLEAHRAKSLRGKGKGNLRGLMTGHIFQLEGYPQKLGNAGYLVVSTHIDIRNNDTSTQAPGSAAHYSCETRFTVQPANSPFRTAQKARKPRLHSEIAVITGYDNSPVWTDSYGRTRLQFIWDRQGQMNQDSSCWIRAVSPWQGENYGAIFIPRPGQEVVVGYYHGDPDKPYIAGRHVNQFNEPPWVLPHNDALSGWRSQSLEGQGSNSVVTDDTPGKLQVQVSSDQANSRLVLGSNTHIDGNQGRSQARGEGFELATEAHGVARANRGMLITTETRAGASAPVKDMGETLARLDDARTLHEDLTGAAQANGAQEPGRDQKAVTAAIRAQNMALKGKAGNGQFPEFTQPHLTLASPAGIETTTAGSTHLASGQHLAVTTGADVAMAAGGSLFGTFGNKLRLTVQKAGMWLVAVSGNIDLRALKDSINLLAKLNVTVTAEKIIISATQEIEVRGGGSFTRWTNGNIYNGTSGQFEVHSAGRLMTGPDSAALPTLPESKPGEQELHFALGALSNDAAHRYVEEPYELYKGSEKIDEGVTDEYGRVVVKNHQPDTKAYTVKLCNGGQFNLMVKDELENDADHQTNRGERTA